MNKVFVPESFNVDFRLVDIEGSPVLPEGSLKDDCFAITRV